VAAKLGLLLPKLLKQSCLLLIRKGVEHEYRLVTDVILQHKYEITISAVRILNQITVKTKVLFDRHKYKNRNHQRGILSDQNEHRLDTCGCPHKTSLGRLINIKMF